MSKNQVIDGYLYNDTSEDFIPLVCHYDSETMITKNGELLQMLQINGINSENISDDLFNLRAMVRTAIHKHAKKNNFAFWVHTIRRKANLDDPTPYKDPLSTIIHDEWRKKNYWDDKYVNRLYITILHNAPEIKIKGFASFINSLSPKVVSKFEELYFTKAYAELQEVVNKILKDLDSYGARKLSIIKEEDKYFSEPMFLYKRIMQLSEEHCELPISDCSSVLASHRYAVGNDVLEVIGKNNKKFASMIGFKSYPEVVSGLLDSFLQTAVEMIVTEVFFFVPKKEVQDKFKYQDYILKVSKNDKLRALKGIDKIIDTDEEGAKFCYQQISCMIIADNMSVLKERTGKASSELAKLGIVHVKEDIDMEKVFWAQLPGNFAFLSRLSPTVVDNVAAFASLHNFPTGSKNSKWGNHVTLLRTEKGTPYFMNFHDKNDNSVTNILGNDREKRITLMNFLVSEASKFQPYTLYVNDNMHSAIFIKAKGGKWFQRDKELINPFLCESSDKEHTRLYLFNFLKIISNHYVKALNEDELNILEQFVDTILALPPEKRILSEMIKKLPDESKEEKKIKERFKIYEEGGKYYKLFEKSESINLSQKFPISFNIEMFNYEKFYKESLPKDLKLVPAFEYEVQTMQSINAALSYAIYNLFSVLDKDVPKLYCINEMSNVINLEYFSEIVESMHKIANENNIVLLATIDISKLQVLYDKDLEIEFIKNSATNFIIPPKINFKHIDKICDLTNAEFKKLNFISKYRNDAFLIRQNGKAIASELSISGLEAVTKFLYSNKKERDAYKKLASLKDEISLSEVVKALYNDFARQ